MRMKAFDNKTYIIYQIEGQFPKLDKDRQYNLYWCPRELTPMDFGERHAKYGESWDKVSPFYKAYGACGECWQRTGLDGFLDKNLAISAFTRIMKYAQPRHNVINWRLVERKITVELRLMGVASAGLVTS